MSNLITLGLREERKEAIKRTRFNRKHKTLLHLTLVGVMVVGKMAERTPVVEWTAIILAGLVEIF